MDADPPVVFVYGTLMPGCSRWAALGPDATAWSDATVKGTLWDTGRGYPAAVFGGTDGEVHGVAVTIMTERWLDVLSRLDEIEGEGALYRRVVVETSVGRAVAYEWLRGTDGLVRIADGRSG